MIEATTEKITTAEHIANYTALTTGAAILDRSDASILVVEDADRADFLQRMTTNNITALRPGRAAVTVLTSPTARVLFVFTVLCREDALWLLPAPGQAASLSKHLRGQIFFMDKVKVRTLEGMTRLRLVGSKAADALTAANVALPDADDTWAEANSITTLRQDRYDLPGYELIVPHDQAASLVQQLEAAGATQLTDPAAYEARRIELGRPAPGAELTDEYNPLEVGLAWTCAENKGCYTGQEIIARQVTYDKVTKTLVGLRVAQKPTPGAEVLAESRNAGTVTSAAYSPALDAPIALAVLKRPHNTPGTRVTVDGIEAEVVELPFV